MKITRVQAIQAHPVPSRVHEPRGPFPDHLFEEPEVFSDYDPEQDEGGANFHLGATAQNNYKAVRHYRCKACHARVNASDLSTHACED